MVVHYSCPETRSIHTQQAINACHKAPALPSALQEGIYVIITTPHTRISSHISIHNIHPPPPTPRSLSQISESSRMFHNLTNQHPIPDHTFDLLRQRTFAIIVLLRPPQQIDIDSRALTGKDLGGQTIAAEINRGAIDLIEQDGGQGAEDLKGEVGAFDDVDGGDEGVDDEGDGGAVVEGDGVGLVGDADGRFGAAGDEDGLVDGGVDLDEAVRGGVVVLDDPFAAVEFFARGLLGRAHAVGFGLSAGDGGLARGGGGGGAALGVGARGHGGAGAEGGVFVRLRRGVDFAETGGDGFAFGELVEDAAHVAGAGAGGGCSVGGHGRGRWRAVEGW